MNVKNTLANVTHHSNSAKPQAAASASKAPPKPKTKKDLNTSTFRTFTPDVIVIEDASSADENDGFDMPDVNIQPLNIESQTNAKDKVDPKVNYCRSFNLNRMLHKSRPTATATSNSTLSSKKSVDSLIKGASQLMKKFINLTFCTRTHLNFNPIRNPFQRFDR